MKNKTTSILLLFLFGFSVPGISQRIKTYQNEKVKHIKKDFFYSQEDYYVLKEDKKIKHGPYAYFNEDGKKKIGQYEKGEPTGVWKFYEGEEAFQIFDYEKDSFLVRKTEFPGKEHIIMKDGEPSIGTLDFEATIVGGYAEIYAYLYRYLLYPKGYQREEVRESIRALLLINESGFLQEIQYLDQPSEKYKKSFDLAFNRAKDLKFYPAEKDGKAVATSIIITLQLFIISESRVRVIGH